MRRVTRAAWAALLPFLAAASPAIAGSITGTVTDSRGMPIAWVDVSAYGSTPWFPVRSTRTDDLGVYALAELPPGSYKLEFHAYSWGGFIDEWHADKESFSTADSVEVAAEETVSGIDAILTRWSSITGRVTDSSGGPISGVNVAAYDLAFRAVDGATTDSSGSYALDRLRAGRYKVKFSSEWYSGFVGEWQADAHDFAAAEVVAVGEEETAAGIDAVLARGGSITGRVTDSGGAALVDVEVRAYGAESAWVASADTDSSGDYTIIGLANGSYRVGFHREDFLDGYYAGKVDLLSADPIAVTEASTTSGIDAVLKRGGSISGNVTDTSGRPLESLRVAAYGLDGEERGSAATDASGFFTIRGLPAGGCKVRFGEDEGAHFIEWYADQPSFDTALAVPVAEGGTTPGIDAVLARLGGLSGTVTDSRGVPIAGVRVEACELDGSWLSGASTDSHGSYSIGGLTAGAYKVRFLSEETGYLSEWFTDKDDHETADPVIVWAAETTSGTDAVLTLGGSIAGMVRDSGGLPIGDVEVVALDLAGRRAGFARTGDSGGYTIGGLLPGGYRVEFRHPLTGNPVEWYAGKPVPDTADVVAVFAETTTPGIDAVFLPGGSIAGRVTCAGGIPLDGFEVGAFAADGSWGGGAHSDPSGSYTISGLPAGGYKVKFETYGQGGCLREWYSGKPDISTADTVSVASGSTVQGVDAVLTPGGSITGVVTDSQGRPIAGVFVGARALDESWTGYEASTDATGAYRIGGLATGGYKVQFSVFEPLDYLGEWYPDAADFQTAAAIAVTAGSTASGIDAVLALGGTIAGAVTDSAGHPIGGVTVIAHGPHGGWVRYAETSLLGSYAIPGLSAGSYKVKFSVNEQTSYVDEWYADQADFFSATAVAVTAAATTSGIDAVLGPGGSIAGTVTDAGGRPIPGVVVVVHALDGDERSLAVTDALGSYSVAGLCTGAYKVEFNRQWRGYFEEWYPDKEDFDAATAVSVTAGETTTGIDAVLTRGGFITGRVTGAAGRPVTQVRVSAFDPSGRRVGEAWTDFSGAYTVDRLRTGSYKVSFNREALGYITAWYAEATDFATASAVGVTIDATTPGIDATLTLPDAWAPVLGVIGDRTVMEGSLLAFTVLARDPDGGFLTFGVSGLPEGAAFDAGTGRFTWVPGYNQEGTHVLDFFVSDGALTDAERVTITVVNPAGRLFFDDFTDGASAAEWLKVSGAWSAKGRVFTSTSLRKNNFVRILQLDPASFPLGPGKIQAKLKLTSSASRNGPNGMIVFGFLDPAHYRWVKVTKGQILVGQTGAFGGVARGTKKKVARAQALNKFGLYTVKIHPDGWVRVYKGTASKPVLSYQFLDAGAPSVVPGGAGLAASKAKTAFDDVTVWDASGL